MALAIALVNCSSNSSPTTTPLPGISGSWEFIATSTANPGYSTGIEVALKEGQVFVNGNYEENGQISASSQQIAFIGFTPGRLVFGGNCAAATDNVGNNLAGSISGVGGAMNFTYTENGNVFNVTAILDASGQSLDSGTYTEQAAPAGQFNGVCNGGGSNTVIDSGTITGSIVSKLSGTYTGHLCQPLDASCANPQDSSTATLSQSGTTLTMSLLLTGTDNTSFTLTGQVTGNAFSVQGTFQGQTVLYDGYYELTYDSATNTNDIPSLYVVNTSCTAVDQQTCGNVLKAPLTP